MASASGAFRRRQGLYRSVSNRKRQHQARVADPQAGRGGFHGVEPLEPRLLLAVLLNEGFEAGFPGTNGWSVGDAYTTGTDGYWDDVDASFGGEGTHSGSRKGYCAGVGFTGNSSNPHYPNYMYSYMSRSIDLTGYSDATLSFWYKIPGIERDYDYAEVYIDGTLVWQMNERVASWTNQIISLNNYLGGVHTLEFGFYADYSITYEGWYLDDIVVTVDAGSDDPNDQFFEAITVASGTTTNGTISPSGTEPDPGTDLGDVDMYKFTAYAGQTLAFDIDRPSGTLDSYIRLFNSSGTQLAYSNNDAAPGEVAGTDSYLQYTFSSDGTYYLGVSAYGNNTYSPTSGGGDIAASTGPYQLIVTDILQPDPNDQISEATTITIGSSITADIRPKNTSPDPGSDQGDVDMYRFTVSAGQRLCFDIDTPAGGSLNSYLRLFNSSGTLLPNGYNNSGAAPGETSSQDSYLEYTFSSAGTYYVGVSGYGNVNYNALTGTGDISGTTGQYTLTVTYPNTPPVVNTFTANPNPALLGESVHLEVTATDTAPGLVKSVKFFRDANGNGVAEAGELIGQDTVGKNGVWALDWDTSGQSPPTAALLAVAYDDNLAASTPYALALTLNAETTPPQILGWSSAGMSGAAAEMLLAIPDTGTFVESRGLGKLVIQFSEAILPASFTAGSVQVTGLDANGVAVNLTGISISTSTRNGNTEGVIEFTPPLPDPATYTVRIQGVTDLVANPLTGDDDRVITTVRGDTDGDAAVTASDYIAMKKAFGKSASSAGAAVDLDCSGAVGYGDLAALRGSMGNSIIPAQITGWSSAAAHGAAGEMLRAIPDSGAFIESRGVQELVIQFSEAINPASLTPGSVVLTGVDANGFAVNLSGIAVSTSTRSGGMEGVIEFSPALPDLARYTVQVQGLTDQAGFPLAGDNDRVFTAVRCDGDGDGRVGASDYLTLKAALGAPVTSANAAFDFNCSGTLDQGDLTLLDSYMGNSMDPTSAAGGALAEAPAIVPVAEAEIAAAMRAAAEVAPAVPLAQATEDALRLGLPRLAAMMTTARFHAARSPDPAADCDVLRLARTRSARDADADGSADEGRVSGPALDVLARARARAMNRVMLNVLAGGR